MSGAAWLVARASVAVAADVLVVVAVRFDWYPPSSELAELLEALE